jgi:hypothetical protein
MAEQASDHLEGARMMREINEPREVPEVVR